MKTEQITLACQAGTAKNVELKLRMEFKPNFVGSPPIADLRYGEEYGISPSTVICAAKKG